MIDKKRGDDMAMATCPYEPDYTVSPGEVLAERIEARGMSQAEFAKRCGLPPELIGDIIAGNSPVEPRTALQFERALGMDASIWLGIESDYRLHLARKATAASASLLETAR